MARKLNIDIETYSDEDLSKVGVYKYANSPNFEVMIFAYSLDDGEVIDIDLTIEDIPDEVLEAIEDPSVIKYAFNAQFERVCLGVMLGKRLDPRQWRCTMVHATMLGLPSSLGQCAKFLKIPVQKDAAGTKLINFFSKPRKKDSGRNMPEDEPKKWRNFCNYCNQDVVVEMAIGDEVEKYPVPESEWELYALDQEINDRGVRMDSELVDAAAELVENAATETMDNLRKMSGIENPNSRNQVLAWLADNGVKPKKLDKDAVMALLDSDIPDHVKDFLRTRLNLSNSSTKKYFTMQRAQLDDNRIHGVAQFYGASRTGRWAGRLVQTQNLPRNYLANLDVARDLVRAKDVEGVEMIYENLENTLKQLIRTAIIPEEGLKLIVSDFNAIEARVLAWLANEKWRLDVFNTHGKLYEASAAMMFNVPLESIDKHTPEGAELRARGKVAELAAGYQGSVGAMKQMDKDGGVRPDLSARAIEIYREENGIDTVVMDEDVIELMIDENYKRIVDAWRAASKSIVSFWYDVQRAAIKAVEEKTTVRFKKGISFIYKPGYLFIELPSGRRLAYARPAIEEGGRFNKKSLTYYGKDEGRAAFAKTATYGGKLVENITQAIARDLLAEKMKLIDASGEAIVFHVHDEVVIEGEAGTLEKINEIMALPVSWAKGLPLSADGFETEYYMKD
ncbi:DNA polymerase [Listeria booriae]|uniref:DNA polymerase n=1 Tax=Listeria booriae TaxID=1552123 RepID=UPI00162A4067|nr:DNA polymerase [Listeria booriae]MBC1272663.1 DNA polymerase [Listeria booriae]